MLHTTACPFLRKTPCWYLASGCYCKARVDACSVPLSGRRLRPRCRELQSLIDFSSTLRCRRYDTADTAGFNHKEFSFVLWQSKIDQINSFDSVITCVWSREEERNLENGFWTRSGKTFGIWYGCENATSRHHIRKLFSENCTGRYNWILLDVNLN